MGELMMVAENTSVLHEVDMPLFYMNDFSVLGLVVPALPRALRVLEEIGFNVILKNHCARIRFHNQLNLTKLFETLNRNNVSYHTADLVSGAYQG